MCPPALGAALRRGGGGWGPLPSGKTKTLSLTGFSSFPLTEGRPHVLPCASEPGTGGGGVAGAQRTSFCGFSRSTLTSTSPGASRYGWMEQP
eukprot:1504453-Prymnesium_polylepis.1